MRIHKKSDFPSVVEGEKFSVDVITCDKEGLLNLAFYNYDTKEWSFHSDTLIDYKDVDFVWIYPPIRKMINVFNNAV